VHKNNFRRQRRIENRVGETVRIASIVQKGIASGRSSYVEMRALDRLMIHNIKTKTNQIRKSLSSSASSSPSSAAVKLNGELDRLLVKVIQTVSEGYTRVLTPNGIIQERELDHLLSLDSDIVICLGLVELQPWKNSSILNTIKELIKEREMFVNSLKASGES
jgi:hypothetical protein